MPKRGDKVLELIAKHRNSKRPPLPDNVPPEFSRGLPGFLAEDPGGFVKGAASVPFTIAPDMIGLLLDGMNKLNNITQPGSVLPDELRDAFPSISGDPIREILGATSAQAQLGEMLMPIATAAKAAVAGGKGLAALLAGVPLAKLGGFKSTTVGRIRNATRSKGGFSVNLETGEIPSEGLMVGKFANDDPRNIVLDRPVTGKDIVEFAEINKKQLSDPDNFFGTWLDRETGKTYLDVVKKFPEDQVRQATKFGERSGQISLFSVEELQTLPVGSWRQFIESPQFAGRMDEMGRIGSDYLKKHQTSEWWDVHGTLFEDVYGKENLNVLAGFIASTAPLRDPATNLRVATEYMRRFLIGEPIIQPHWRVPAGAVQRHVGTQIGMESVFKNNLVKASQGRTGDLEKNKIREEAMALLGDPEAVVLDRHWARLAENPKEGIFTAAREGVVNAGKDYELLKVQVTRAANESGKSPRDYSAVVWTGIRETIKNQARLFGQTFRKGSIQGASKGYADIFNDLIAEKANTIGITYKELTTKLKNGDAELLSLILASPLGAWAYQKSRDDRSGDNGDTLSTPL